MKKIKSHVIPAPSPHMICAPLLNDAKSSKSEKLPDGTDGPEEGEDWVEWFLRHEGASK